MAEEGVTAGMSRVLTAWRLLKARRVGAVWTDRSLDALLGGAAFFATTRRLLGQARSTHLESLIDRLFMEARGALHGACVVLAAFHGFGLTADLPCLMPDLPLDATAETAAAEVHFYLVLYDELLTSGLAELAGAESGDQGALLLHMLAALAAEPRLPLPALPAAVAAAAAADQEGGVVELKAHAQEDAWTVENVQPGFAAAIERVLAECSSGGMAYNLNALEAVLRSKALLTHLQYAISLIDGVKAACDMVDIRVTAVYFKLLYASLQQLTVAERADALAHYYSLYGHVGLSKFNDQTGFAAAWTEAQRSLCRDADSLSADELHLLITWGLLVKPRNFLFDLFDLAVASRTATAPLVNVLRRLPCVLALEHEAKPFVLVGLTRFVERAGKIDFGKQRAVDNAAHMLAGLCSRGEGTEGASPVVDGTAVMRDVLWRRLTGADDAPPVRRGLVVMATALLQADAPLVWRRERWDLDQGGLSAVDMVAEVTSLHADGRLPLEPLADLLAALAARRRAAEPPPTEDADWLRAELAALPPAVALALAPSLSHFLPNWKVTVPRCLYRRLRSDSAKELEPADCAEHDGVECAVGFLLKLDQSLSDDATQFLHRLFSGLDVQSFVGDGGKAEEEAAVAALQRVVVGRLRAVDDEGAARRLVDTVARLTDALQPAARPLFVHASERQSDELRRRTRAPLLLLAAALDAAHDATTRRQIIRLVDALVADALSHVHALADADRLPHELLWLRHLVHSIGRIANELDLSDQSRLYIPKSAQLEPSMQPLKKAILQFGNAAPSTPTSTSLLDGAAETDCIPIVDGWIEPPAVPDAEEARTGRVDEQTQTDASPSLRRRQKTADDAALTNGLDDAPHAAAPEASGGERGAKGRGGAKKGRRPKAKKVDEAPPRTCRKCGGAHLAMDCDARTGRAPPDAQLGGEKQWAAGDGREAEARASPSPPVVIPDYNPSSGIGRGAPVNAVRAGRPATVSPRPGDPGIIPAPMQLLAQSQDVRNMQQPPPPTHVPGIPTSTRFSSVRSAETHYGGGGLADGAQPTVGWARGGGGRECYNCGEAGHLARACPQLHKRALYGERTCFNCNKIGHESRDCDQPHRPQH